VKSSYHAGFRLETMLCESNRIERRDLLAPMGVINRIKILNIAH